MTHKHTDTQKTRPHKNTYNNTKIATRKPVYDCPSPLSANNASPKQTETHAHIKHICRKCVLVCFPRNMLEIVVCVSCVVCCLNPMRVLREHHDVFLRRVFCLYAVALHESDTVYICFALYVVVALGWGEGGILVFSRMCAWVVCICSLWCVAGAHFVCRV